MNTSVNDKYISNSAYHVMANPSLKNIGLIANQSINSNVNSRIKYQSWSGT